MAVWRLTALIGALAASVLGSFAVGVAFGGLQSLARAEASGSLFLLWGLLGLAGVAGLWLATLVGPGSLAAAGLIGCGLAADAVLVLLIGKDALSVAPIVPSGFDAAYAALVTVPFLVGTAYICHAVVRGRRSDARQHEAV